jgi:hypothetical protein
MKSLLESCLLMLCAVMLSTSVGAKPPRDVLVFSSGDEKKYPPPTAENPTYYLPLSGGFHAEGPSVAREDSGEKITKEEIFAALVKPLAAKHFLPADKDHPPTILLVAQWGRMRPDLKEGQTFWTEYDAKRAAGLTGGTRAPLGTMEYEEARQNMADDRYVLIVSAYDYAASKKERKKVLHWSTRMSVVMNPTTFAESLTPMVTAGTQWFGRDSMRARAVDLTEKSTNINIGEAVVIETIEQQPESPQADTKEKKPKKR